MQISWPYRNRKFEKKSRQKKKDCLLCGQIGSIAVDSRSPHTETKESLLPFDWNDFPFSFLSQSHDINIYIQYYIENIWLCIYIFIHIYIDGKSFHRGEREIERPFFCWAGRWGKVTNSNGGLLIPYTHTRSSFFFFFTERDVDSLYM